MQNPENKKTALQLFQHGHGPRQVSRLLNIPYSTSQYWFSLVDEQPLNKADVYPHGALLTTCRDADNKYLSLFKKIAAHEQVPFCPMKVGEEIGTISGFFKTHTHRITHKTVAMTASIAGSQHSGSFVLAAPQLRLETLPRLVGNRPRFIITTGSLDHEDPSALLVDKTGFFTHVVFKGNCAYWTSANGTTWRISNQGEITGFHKAKRVIVGDLHHPYDVYFPPITADEIILHDALDFGPISRHKDPSTWSAEIWDHITTFKAFIKSLKSRLSCSVKVVESNHDYWVNGLLSTDPREITDKQVKRLYHELSLKVLDKKVILSELYGADVDLISFKNGVLSDTGIIIALHGHKRSRFDNVTPRSMNQLGSVVVHGHTHKPSRNGNVLSTGTCGPLNPSYGGFLGSFAHGDVVEYHNGVVVNYVPAWTGV
jgi:hypothetical protein